MMVFAKYFALNIKHNVALKMPSVWKTAFQLKAQLQLLFLQLKTKE